MKVLSRFLLGLLLLLTMAALPAMADMLQFDLTVPNPTLSGQTGPYAHVVINRTDATHATVTVNALGIYKLGDGGVFALNLANTHVNVSNLAVSGGNGSILPITTCLGNNCTPADFGKFNLTFTGHDGAGGAVTSLSFNLTLTSGTWASVNDILANNSQGYFARGHIFAPTITGYAVNGGTPTPEPGSLALIGTGLVALGSFVRRWRR